MSLIFDLFSNSDVSPKFGFAASQQLKLGADESLGFRELVFEFKRIVDSDTNSLNLILYTHDTDVRTVTVSISQILQQIEKFIENDIQIYSEDTDGTKYLGIKHHIYTKQLIFYLEISLPQEALIFLQNLASKHGIRILIRGTEYIDHLMKLKKPQAFISHDSRDKELIAAPLALGLMRRKCTVWYDSNSLKIGDSLRTSIESGLKEAKKCILVITPNFLSNPGWGKKEFDSIFTRELVKSESVILPIWHNVTTTDVYNYSPSLVDRFALIWPNRSEFSNEEEYLKRVEIIISGVHTAIQ